MQQYSERESWSDLSVQRRCKIVATAAGMIADSAEDWIGLCRSEQRVDPVETITAELLPLCSALRFIGSKGARLLRARHVAVRARPLWLWGVRSQIRRDPHGRVLVIGTWNYPLFLVGVQVAQALASGNQVLLKPAQGCEAISQRLAETFYRCGVPEQTLCVLASATEAATAAIDSGVDLIVLTGSAATGRAVLRRAAATLTPSIMELSGCDAVLVLPEADLERAAKAIAFGLTFNGGATCIGPRRLILESSTADSLLPRLGRLLQSQQSIRIHRSARQGVADMVQDAIQRGASDSLDHLDLERLRIHGDMSPLLLDQVKPQDPIASADMFAPVLSLIRLGDMDQAVEIVNECPYRLSASVFGPRQAATAIAAHLRVGSVSINDLIVPTADPRVPFGGRGSSGFGVTRGEQGLLAMTVPVVTGERRGNLLLHLMPRRSTDAQSLLGALQLLHGEGLTKRWSGFKRFMKASLSGERLDDADSSPGAKDSESANASSVDSN